MTVRDQLTAVLSVELVGLLEAYIDERVAEAVHEAVQPSAGPAWLTLEAAAEQLGCSPDAVRMRANRGRLDARRQGRRTYVSAASVDALA